MSDDVTAETLATWRDRVAGEAARVSEAFEARTEHKATLGATYEKGAMRSLNESRLAGLSVRIWVDGAAGFASGHDPSSSAVRELVREALSIAESNARQQNASFSYRSAGEGKVRYEPTISQDPFQADPEDIATVLKRAHDQAHDEDPGAFVRCKLGASSRRVAFADASGRTARTRFVLTTLQAQAVHRDGPRLGEGFAWASGERGLGGFEGDERPEALGRRAAERGREASTAIAAPAGRQRVLCDPVLSGLLAHESFGHLAEYDLIASGWSILADQRGNRFADEQVSVADAPSVPGQPNQGIRLPYDDEGVEGRTVRMLDQGVLTDWMHARGSGAELGEAATGNGRALSVRCEPLVRMRNTYFEPGDWSIEEALEALGDGVYLIEGRGGSPSSDGSFMFTAVRGYKVENGEITEPLRSTAISGNILDFLEGVEAATDDFHVTTSNFGGCSKRGQGLLPVGMGGPHLLVDGALVGGEA